MAVAHELPVREAIHKAVDELSPESVKELASFVAFLRFKETQEMEWFYRLQERYEAVRSAADQMTEAEVDEAIDEAIAAVRHERKADRHL
jgi:hypothetical protein